MNPQSQYILAYMQLLKRKEQQKIERRENYY